MGWAFPTLGVAMAVALGAGTAAAPSGARFDGHRTAVAAPAAAEPTPIGGRAAIAFPATLGFDGAGRGVASWVIEPDSGRSRSSRGGVAWFSPAAGWRAGARLPRTTFAHDLEVGRGGHVALLEAREAPAGRRRTRSVIVVRLARTGTGRFGRARRLDAGRIVPAFAEEYEPTRSAPRVAVTADGTVVAAWERRGRSRTDIVVRERRPGRSFGRARVLFRGAGDPVLDVAEDGTGVLLWRRPGPVVPGRRLYARLRATGGAWGPVHAAATLRPWGTTEHVSADVGGGATAVGVLQTQRGGFVRGVLIRASVDVRTSGARAPWREIPLAEYIFTSGPGTSPGVLIGLRVLVAAGADGRVHAAWPQPVDGVMRVMVAQVAPTPSAPRALSAGDAALGDAAAGPGGAFAVAWAELEGTSATVGLGEQAPGGDLVLSPPIATEPMGFGVRVAYNPATGRPAVLWTQGSYPRGSRPVVWTSPAQG